MEPATFHVEDDRFVCQWTQDGIGIVFTVLREKSDGLHGEVRVQQIDDAGTPTGTVHSARLNLSSTSQRQTLVRQLSKRSKGEPIDWDSYVEEACIKTTTRFRQGSPAVDLSLGQEEAEDRYAVYPLLPLGETCILYGDGGSGKSYLALSLALAVATSHPLPGGIRPLVTGSTLYLDYETDHKGQIRRLRRLSRGLGLPDPPPFYYRRLDRALADDVQTIREDVRRLTPALFIVDSIAPACGGEPESAEVILRFMNTIRSVAPTATRVIISHISKGDLEKRRAKPFGSTFTRNAARACWEIRRSNEEETDTLTLALFHDKSNDDRLHRPIALKFGFDVPDRVTLSASDLQESPDLAASTTLKTRIRYALSGGAKTLVDLSEELEANPRSVNTALRRMTNVVQLESKEGRGGKTLWGLQTDREPGSDG